MSTKTTLNEQKTEKAQNYIKIITIIFFFLVSLFFSFSSKIQAISRYPNQNVPWTGPSHMNCDDRNNRTKRVDSLFVCLFGSCWRQDTNMTTGPCDDVCDDYWIRTCCSVWISNVCLSFVLLCFQRAGSSLGLVVTSLSPVTPPPSPPPPLCPPPALPLWPRPPRAPRPLRASAADKVSSLQPHSLWLVTSSLPTYN